MQADGMGNIVKLLAANLLQRLALGRQLLVDLDDLFGHDLVRFLGPANQSEIRARRDSFVPVRIKTYPHQDRFPTAILLARRVRHARNLRNELRMVKLGRGAASGRLCLALYPSTLSSCGLELASEMKWEDKGRD